MDVQTWGLSVLAANWVDMQFGEGTSFRIWSNTRQLACYVRDGVLQGVGYTNGQQMLSDERTLGAVLMAKAKAKTYRPSNPDWTQQLNQDADTTLLGVHTLKISNPDGTIHYLYANMMGRRDLAGWPDLSSAPVQPMAGWYSCSWTSTRFH